MASRPHVAGKSTTPAGSVSAQPAADGGASWASTTTSEAGRSVTGPSRMEASVCVAVAFPPDKVADALNAWPKTTSDKDTVAEYVPLVRAKPNAPAGALTARHCESADTPMAA